MQRALLGLVFLLIGWGDAMSSLIFVHGNGPATVDAVAFTGPTPARAVFIKLVHINITSSIGVISADTINSFALPVAQFEGAMPSAGPYAVPDWPANPVDVHGLVVTVTLGGVGTITEKVYYFDPTSTGLEGCIIDCHADPRVGVAVHFDPVLPTADDGRPITDPLVDHVVTRHRLSYVTDAAGCFLVALKINTMLAPAGTQYRVWIAEDPPEIFYVTIPDQSAVALLEDLVL